MQTWILPKPFPIKFEGNFFFFYGDQADWYVNDELPYNSISRRNKSRTKKNSSFDSTTKQIPPAQYYVLYVDDREEVRKFGGKEECVGKEREREGKEVDFQTIDFFLAALHQRK